ncbi:hypothetical protein Tco_0249768, partial [Tanacetum coccineum]
DKSLWEVIKSRFGSNVESKKMQKNVLKHQFEIFSTTSNESLDKDKAYDRFQKLINKYVADILKKFDFLSITTATTPIESNKPLVKDEDGEDVDVHITGL